MPICMRCRSKSRCAMGNSKPPKWSIGKKCDICGKVVVVPLTKGAIIDTPRLDSWIEQHPRIRDIHDALDTWMSEMIRRLRS